MKRRKNFSKQNQYCGKMSSARTKKVKQKKKPKRVSKLDNKKE